MNKLSEEEFVALLLRCSDGAATEEEQARLRSELQQDAARRAAAVSIYRLHGLLAEHSSAENQKALLQKGATPHRKSTRRALAVRKGPSRVWVIGTIAAAALFGLAGFFMLREIAPEPQARAVPPAPKPMLKKDAPAPVPVPEEPRPLPPTPPPTPAPAPAPKEEAPRVTPPPAPLPPPPTPKPDPRPQDPPQESPAAPAPVQERKTRAVAATFLHTRGNVMVVADGAASPASAGHALLTGQSIETRGATSAALIEYPDRTQVELTGDTRVTETSEAQAGKRLHLDHGRISALVARQPADQPMLFITPQAQARVLGTALALHSDANATILEVDDGKVKLIRARDGISADVSGGYYAIAAPKVELSPRPLPQQAKKAKPNPKVDQVKVDTAIRNGITFLKTQMPRLSKDHLSHFYAGQELVLWTMVHAGVPETDPDFTALLQEMLEGELKFTYRVSVQAMILEDLDRVKYQARLAQCAQFLVDNMAANGQWGYGKPTPFAPEIPPLPAKKDVATGGRPKPPPPAPTLERVKPRVIRLIPVKKMVPGGSGGDNSNTQYAALGMLACHDAGIRFPKDVLESARNHWRRAQVADVRSKDAYSGKGWFYGIDKFDVTGSMTAGGLGSLVIYNRLLGEDWKQDKAAHEAIAWLTKNYTVSTNPGAAPREFAYLYYMYALERAGALYGIETFGKNEWYPDGVKVLLETQKADGSWTNSGDSSGPMIDTCFAILFLKRATDRMRPDVASTDRILKR